MQDSPTKSIGKVGTTKGYRMRSQKKQILVFVIVPRFGKITRELRKSG